jgi:hypothetical protein
LKNDFTSWEIAHFTTILSDEVALKNQQNLPIEKRDTYSKVFLQVFNLWTQSEEDRKMVMNKRLSQISADLMSGAHLRIYHD